MNKLRISSVNIFDDNTDEYFEVYMGEENSLEDLKIHSIGNERLDYLKNILKFVEDKIKK